jgi:hypothetical protein
VPETWLFGASEECHTIINLRKVIPYSHNTRTATRQMDLFFSRIDRLNRKARRRDATKSFADTIYIWRDYGFNRVAYGRAVRDREVVGSNPIAPTFKTNKLWLPIGSHILFMTLSTTLSIQTVRAE